MREPRTEVYSYFGIPTDRFVQAACALKIAIDPLREYFGAPLQEDTTRFDRVVLIHGCEPPEVNDIRDLILEHSSKFSRIYSFDPVVLASCANSELFCFGSCWVLEEHEETRNPFGLAKDFEVSYIRSQKRHLPGHLFRDEIDEVLGAGHAFRLLFPRERIPQKQPLFARAMFHVAAENSRHPNYFTEKLIDCFASFTVPIYWGCPNIGDYFDRAGMLTFESAAELTDILARLRPSDYHERVPSLLENYKRAVRDHAFFFRRVNKIIEREGAVFEESK